MHCRGSEVFPLSFHKINPLSANFGSVLFGNSYETNYQHELMLNPRLRRLFLFDMTKNERCDTVVTSLTVNRKISQQAFRCAISYFLRYLWTAIEIGGNPYFILFMNILLIKYVKMWNLPSLITLFRETHGETLCILIRYSHQSLPAYTNTVYIHVLSNPLNLLLCLCNYFYELLDDAKYIDIRNLSEQKSLNRRLIMNCLNILTGPS